MSRATIADSVSPVGTLWWYRPSGFIFSLVCFESLMLLLKHLIIAIFGHYLFDGLHWHYAFVIVRQYDVSEPGVPDQIFECMLYFRLTAIIRFVVFS